MVEKSRRLIDKAFFALKKYYKHISAAVLIMLLVLIIYWRDMEILANEVLRNEAFNYILLMPFFACFLFYMKRDMIMAALGLEKHRRKSGMQYLDELIGVILCLIAILIYWYGSYTFYPLEYHLFSLPIFIIGIMLIMFNSKVLIACLIPTLFLFFIIPPPIEGIYIIGGHMANFNTQASYTLLRGVGMPVSLSSAYGPPTINVTTTSGISTSFAIDVPCSGIYTLMAFTMFAVFLAFIASASVFKKLLLFALGLILFEILNIIRITSIISVGYFFGEEAAIFIFHAVAGLLLIFIGMLLTLVVAEKFLKIQVIPTFKELAPCPKCKASLKNSEHFCINCGKFLGTFTTSISHNFWAKLLLLILACSIITISINAPTFAIVQGPIGVTSSLGWENATDVFPTIPNYQLRFIYRDTSYEKLAHQDAALLYIYFPDNMSKPAIYVDVGVASTISNLHSWEVCLITWQTSMGLQPLVTVLDSKEIQLLENVPLIARYIVFKHPENYTQITLYWYEKATFRMGATVEQKYVRISLIIITSNATAYQQFENELFTFGQLIAAHWEPLKNQSLISLGVPTQQLLLIASVVFVAFTKTAEYTNEKRRKANNLKLFNNFASAKEKIVLQAILDLAKEKKNIETKEIVEAVKKRVGKTVKTSEIAMLLSRLEDYRFVSRKIASVQNKPKLVWKTSVLGI